MSLLFGKKQLGVSIVTAKGPDAPQLIAHKFAVPTPFMARSRISWKRCWNCRPPRNPPVPFGIDARTVAMYSAFHAGIPGARKGKPGPNFFERVCVYLPGELPERYHPGFRFASSSACVPITFPGYFIAMGT